jgi:hypothetical protein
MDNENKDAFIEQIVKETGLDYASVFATLNKAVGESHKLKTTEEKDALALEKSKVDLAKSKNDLAKSKRDLAEGGKSDSQKEEEKMRSALPTSFTDQADAEKKRAQFVRDFGTKGASYWDAVFYRADSKDNGEYTYTFGEAPKDKKTDKSNDPLGIL